MPFAAHRQPCHKKQICSLLKKRCVNSFLSLIKTRTLREKQGQIYRPSLSRGTRNAFHEKVYIFYRHCERQRSNLRSFANKRLLRRSTPRNDNCLCIHFKTLIRVYPWIMFMLQESIDDSNEN
jgi:hypothetical protein